MGAPGSQPGPGGDRPGPSGPRPCLGHGSEGEERPLAGPGSACRPGPDDGTETREGSPPHAPAAAHRGRAPRRAPRRPRGRRRGPARAPVRRVHAPAWTSPSRRRSTCSSSPATCSTPTSSRAAPWSASPPSSPASPQARIRSVLVPGTHDVYDRSSVYRAYDLAALAGTPAGRGDGHRAHAGATRGSTSRALDAVVHGPCFPTKRAPHSPLRDLAAVETPEADLAHRPAARRRRHPRPHGPRRGRGHDRRDRRQRPRLPRARPLARGPGREDARASPTPTRAPPSPSPSTRTRPARCCSSRSTARRATSTVEVEERVVGRTTFERREIDAATVESQPALIAQPARRPPTRTSCSTCA